MNFKIHKWARELELPYIEKLTLMILLGYANAKTGECHPGTDRLSKETGLHRKTVGKALKGMVNRGLLIMKSGGYRFGGSGGRKAHEYTVNAPEGVFSQQHKQETMPEPNNEVMGTRVPEGYGNEVPTYGNDSLGSGTLASTLWEPECHRSTNELTSEHTNNNPVDVVDTEKGQGQQARLKELRAFAVSAGIRASTIDQAVEEFGVEHARRIWEEVFTWNPNQRQADGAYRTVVEQQRAERLVESLSHEREAKELIRQHKQNEKLLGRAKKCLYIREQQHTESDSDYLRFAESMFRDHPELLKQAEGECSTVN